MSTVTRIRTADPTCDRSPAAIKVAYLMSRFPKLTETFVLYEILEVERLGVPTALFPLRRERAPVMHAEAQRLVDRATFTPLLLSWQLVGAHLFFLLRRPAAYLAALATLLRANWGSPRYLAGAVIFFPKAVLLARLATRQRVGHLHAHFASHPAAVAWVIHRLTGIPYSFTAHGSDLHRDRHMLREKVAAAAFVATISHYNRRVILDHCGPGYADRVEVIRCGIDTDRFQPRTAATPWDEGRGPFTIVCTGTLHEVKGQRTLIEACRRLADRQLDFVCHLVGDGPDRAELEALVAACGLGDRVRFHGQRTQDELRRLLAAADVVAAPSVPTQCGRREGIPVALMEALGCQVAAVASRLSGIPELIEHEATGLLVPPGDAGALADALDRLAGDHDLRRQLAAAGRDRVLREFNLSANAAALVAHIQTATSI